jgi:hypothetical protein
MEAGKTIPESTSKEDPLPIQSNGYIRGVSAPEQPKREETDIDILDGPISSNLRNQSLPAWNPKFQDIGHI